MKPDTNVPTKSMKKKNKANTTNQNCIICGSTLNYKVENGGVSLCKRKRCIKKFVKMVGRFIQAIDKEAHIDSDGFLYNNKLIRYGHFNEDFEKIWKKKEFLH